MLGVLNASAVTDNEITMELVARDIFKVSHLYKLISTQPSCSLRPDNKRHLGRGYRAVIFTREITRVLLSQKIGKVKRLKNAAEVKITSISLLSYSNTRTTCTRK